MWNLHYLWSPDLYWSSLCLALHPADKASYSRRNGCHLWQPGTAQADFERMEVINAEIGLDPLLQGETTGSIVFEKAVFSQNDRTSSD